MSKLCIYSIFFILLLSLGCKEQSAPVDAPLPKIGVISVDKQEVFLQKDFVGQVYGKVDIPIRARVEGFLEGIHFKEGRAVKKEQLLYEIDPAPFQQQVAAAKSELASAQAELVRSTNDLERIEPLAEMNALSQRDLDAAVARKIAAEAMVNAAIAGVKAEEINLGYTKVYSPINGVIGKTKAKIGEFVGRDPNPVILNTVSRVDSVRVDFFLTEDDYLAMAREYKDEVKAIRESDVKGERIDSTKRQALKLILSDGSLFGYDGYVDFVDRGVGESTGSVLIQSTFPNPDQLIKPGQFARVRVTTEKVKDGILIPQRCVNEFQGSFFVLKVDENNKVEQSEIEIRGPYKDYYLVKTGLEYGEKVVYDGIQKVNSGMTIIPKDTIFTSQFNEEK